MIAIIDYDAGNLGSVQKALDFLGVSYKLLNSGAGLTDPEISGVILPGVGAFGASVEKLQSRNFFEPLKHYIKENRPFLGICLGMQLLMQSSEETPGIKGLGVIRGICRKFTLGKVPQIGWNRIVNNKDSNLLKDVLDDSAFYFIHSYYVDVLETECVAATTDYHIPFTSAIERGNVHGVQFHPEKSGDIGLQVLYNWISQSSSASLDKKFWGVQNPFYKKGFGRRRHNKIRIIPCLDVDNGRVVKGINFKNIRDAGNPVELARRYNDEGADEITFLDIGATHKSRDILLDIVEKVSREIFVPLCVGGGISSLDDIRRVLNAGADKVSICSAAIRDPEILTEGARVFGSQCIVLSIDAGKVGNKWHAFLNGGRIDSGKEAVQWAIDAEQLGAGEILLNSIDCDGMQDGYDLELTRIISESVNIPVIASGGAGRIKHLEEAVQIGKADAVLLASLLHDNQLTIKKIKDASGGQGLF
jgi:imidazole glycerol phosphate synthase glutamine amidotransferase subunit